MAHFHVNKTHMLIIVLSQLIKNKSANKGLFTVVDQVQTGREPPKMCSRVQNSLPSLDVDPFRHGQHSRSGAHNCFIRRYGKYPV